MTQTQERKPKFCVAAIFIAIMALLMIIGYVYFLKGFIEDLNDGGYYFNKRDYIRGNLFVILSIIPILSYVFLSVVLFMKKKGKLLFIAVATVVLLQLSIGGAYYFLAYSFLYDYWIGAAGIGLASFVIAMVCLFCLAKLRIPKIVKLIGSILLVCLYVMPYCYNIIISLPDVDFTDAFETTYIVEYFFWVTITVLALLFLMLWLRSDYTDYVEETRGNPAEVKTEKPVKPAVKSDLAWAKELRELKALQDEGLITEEEFSAKKKQILGL